MKFDQVPPESFIRPRQKLPESGRGLWNKRGIDWTWRYEYDSDEVLIGSRAEDSLDHWAVSAAVAAIQRRLMSLGIETFPDEQLGLFNRRTKTAVQTFQTRSVDPATSDPLETDGTVGRSDTRALWTPVIDSVETEFLIPHHYLRGLLNHESQLDPGAVGSIIYYGEDKEFRGVDRGFGQINSLAVPEVTWQEAYRARHSIGWSGANMRDKRNWLKSQVPMQNATVLWMAAICSHNSPVNGLAWAKEGEAPNAQAAGYVDRVLEAIY